VVVLVRAEPQGHGQRVQHGERRAGAASLLEPGVPGGADVRQLSDLLPAQARRAAPDARRQPGGLGVRSAGWLPPATPALDTDVGRLRSVLETNVVGSFIVTKHAAPVMIRGGGGRIVYMSSMIGVQANPGLAGYGASKAGVKILSNVVHRELADQGVRTVALAPGLTDTPGLRASVGDDYIARVASAYPGGRIGLPEDIVALTVFLCSDAAGHISGTLLPGTG
jgi:NAD(P)-dependent dehydrogenase (short-subunit alcohol dehydrogenase family)